MVGKILVLSCIFLSAVIPVTAAKPYLYALQKTQIGNNGNVKAVMVRVYNQRTAQTLWRHSCYQSQTTVWSKDHGSLAVFGGLSDVTVWRAKLQTKRYTLTEDQRMSGLLDMKWSSDARFLAFLNWTSGGWDLHQGKLWVLDTRTGKIRQVNSKSVGLVSQYFWTGKKHLVYEVPWVSVPSNPKNGSNYAQVPVKTFHFVWL